MRSPARAAARAASSSARPSSREWAKPPRPAARHLEGARGVGSGRGSIPEVVLGARRDQQRLQQIASRLLLALEELERAPGEGERGAGVPVHCRPGAVELAHAGEPGGRGRDRRESAVHLGEREVGVVEPSRLGLDASGDAVDPERDLRSRRSGEVSDRLGGGGDRLFVSPGVGEQARPGRELVRRDRPAAELASDGDQGVGLGERALYLAGIDEGERPVVTGGRGEPRAGSPLRGEDGKQSLERRVGRLESAQLSLGEPEGVERFGAAAGRARTRGLVAQRLLGGGDRALELAAPAGDDRLVEPATGELGGGGGRVLGGERDVGLGEKCLRPLGLLVGYRHRELASRHGAQPRVGSPAGKLVGACQHLPPGRVVGDLVVPAREQNEHVGLKRWIVGEAPLDHRLGPRQEIRLRNGESFGVGLGDQEAGKIVGDFSPAQLLERAVALGGRRPAPAAS